MTHPSKPTIAAPGRLGLAGVLIGAGLLGGCTLGGALDGTPPKPSAFAPVNTLALDGSYQGEADLLVSTGRDCPASQNGVLEIGDRTMYFPYQPALEFSAPIGQDGTMHQLVGNAILDGRITGDVLSMSITTPTCRSTYAAHLIWNRS